MQNIVQQQFGTKQPDLLSEDFQFIFPVVGPLTKTEFTGAFSSFKVEEAFTGSYNYFGFNVDPMEPNRVWFFSRGVLTHSGVLLFGAMKMKPSGKTIVGPPQVMSMSFNTEGLCYKLTGGYSVDRTVGNTGGLGGVFGLIHAIGGRRTLHYFSNILSLSRISSIPWGKAMATITRVGIVQSSYSFYYQDMEERKIRQWYMKYWVCRQNILTGYYKNTSRTLLYLAETVD